MVKRFKLPVIRCINPGGAMDSNVTIVNKQYHTVYLKFVETVDIKCYHHAQTCKKVTMWGDGCANQPYCSNRFTLYTSFKQSHCTP